MSVYSINNSRYFSRGDSVISSLVPRLALQQLQQLDERLGRGCLLPMTLSQAAVDSEKTGLCGVCCLSKSLCNCLSHCNSCHF